MSMNQIKTITKKVSPNVAPVLECKTLSFPTFYERVGFENHWDTWMSIYLPTIGSVAYFNYHLGNREKEYLEKKGCEIKDLQYIPNIVKITKTA